MFAMLFMLAACGLVANKPQFKIEGPVSPAVIYLSPCDEGPKGILGVVGFSDRQPGIEVCRAFPLALSSLTKSAKGSYTVLTATQKSGGKYYNIIQDGMVEKRTMARYRVVVGSPKSFRLENFGIVSVIVWMPVRIFDVSTGEVVGELKFSPKNRGMLGAYELSRELLDKLDG